MIAYKNIWLKNLAFKIIVLAIVNFILGLLTIRTNIPSMIDTVVWLPAGISLAATLVWGYRVWPGIIFGSLAVQATVHLGLIGGGTSFFTLISSAFIGLGAVLQGCLGAYLILRFAGFPRSFNRIKDVNILLLGGPVSCLAGGAFGAIASWFAGNTPVVSLVGNWLNWWVAETLGVLIILPLFSVWLSERQRISLKMRFFVILPICLAAVLTFTAFKEIRGGKWDRIEAEFERSAQSMATALDGNFNAHVDALYSIKGLFDSSKTVSPSSQRQLSASPSSSEAVPRMIVVAT